MDSQKVDMFVLTNGKYFHEEQISIIRTRLLEMSDDKWASISMLSFKNPIASLILSLFAGGLGIDRFYLGHIGLGIGKLLTCGGIGIWTIIDWFLIMGATKDVNFQKLATFM